MRPARIEHRRRRPMVAFGALVALLVAPTLLPSPMRAQEAAEPAAQTGDRVITGDHVVEAGQVVSDIAVVGGTLTVRGEVTGNAVVVGGDLIMAETGSVLGDATVTGGRIVQDGGSIRGEMRMLDGVAGAAAAAGAERHGADSERRAAAMEDRIEDRVRERLDSRRGGSRWFDPVRRGFADLMGTIAFGLVLGGLGAALIFYGRPYLEVVSDTLRTSTARSAGVGLAAGFLVVPAFVVMVVALAVSIIGIPVLLIAVPLYPLAIAGGAAMGLLAAAHAIGERTAEQQGRSYERRWSNSYSYLFTGVAMLLSPLVIASLAEMTGFLDFVGTLLKVVTWAVIWVVTMAGFGAVILSRAGTRRAFVAPPPDPAIDDDLLFDDEPSRTPHV